MRILVSGTHSVGKSTFVHDFVSANPDYILEEEPYRALRDWYDIKFGQEATRYHNGIQLLYNISRVKQYHSAKDKVIFDRAPVDYIPYSLYPEKYKKTDITLEYIDSLASQIKDALMFADIIAFIPITDKHTVEMEDDGIRLTDLSYQREIDGYFKDIYFGKSYDIFPNKKPPLLIEIWGPREQRVKQLQDAIKIIEQA